MKKLMLMFALVALFATNAAAQTPWKIIDMEYVTKHGSNCDYDEETCTATFKEKWDRWVDLPELKGDLTGHTRLSVTVLKSNVVLGFYIRYRNSDGEMKQEKAQVFYRQMGKVINEKKVLKVDLTGDGNIGEDILKNVESVRVTMAQAASGAEEPWMVQFGDVVVD